MENGVLTLHTTLTPEALSEKLRMWEPWGHRIDFDNGISTKDFKRYFPFSEQPLNKFGLSSESSALAPDHLRQLAARRLPRFGNPGIRSPGRRQSLLLYVHAKQRRDQLLGFESKCADNVFGIGWIPRNSTVEASACGRPRQIHGANHPGRTETGKTLSSTLRSAAYR